MGLLGGILRGGKDDGDKPQTASTADDMEMLKDLATAPSSMGMGSSARLYDPYEGISQAMGGRKVVFQLPEGPEFVFQEDLAAHRRSWSENLQYYTGTGYLSGGSSGVAAGAYLAMRQKPEAGRDSLKLMANRLLNTSGFASAAMFRSPRGVRSAAVAGAVGALAGGALALARQRFPSL